MRHKAESGPALAVRLPTSLPPPPPPTCCLQEILWSTNIGVGSVYGGVIWGMAYDNSGLLFAGNSNAYSLNVTLTK